MDLSLLLCTSLAFAAAPTEATADAATAPVPSRGPEPVAPVADRAYSRAVNRAARGVGLGFSQGLWGQGFGQSFRADLPFGRRIGQFFGARLHATVVHLESPLADGGQRWDPSLFGGIQLFGRSPVMGGIVRIYGGGGVSIGGRPLPTAQGARFAVGGGGHMGIEAFANPRMSLSVEIGGHSPMHGLERDGGATVMGGANFYFGR